MKRRTVLALVAGLLFGGASILRRANGPNRRDERPGLGYALGRLRGFVAPPLRISPPPPGVVFDGDVPVTVRDGTVLRANVFRPEGDGRWPVILCAHPYGKDNLPEKGPFGYRPPGQYRMLRQPAPVSWSAWTGWEAPDPAFWVPRGYAVVNCDLRGFGTSEGVGNLFTRAEAEDVYDLIGWAADQPWSTGRVGMNGVSYLAISQYGAAALRPPGLEAICPWEGLSDVYRDLAYPGGVREDGFIRFWSRGVRRAGRNGEDLRRKQLEHPLRDGWWRERTPPVADIEVPILVCGSFSDQQLHTRGSFRAFEGAGSPRRWLYTHRGGKWAEYYSKDALAAQQRFFDHYLKGEENGMESTPPVRLEVREDRDKIHEVRGESSWPLANTRWTQLDLGADGSLGSEPPETGTVAFGLRSGRASFTWRLVEDVEISGPMALRLSVELRGADDACLFVGVQKLRNGRVVPFEGSYGFGHDRVTTGWLRVSLRKLDPAVSTPWLPVHALDEAQPMEEGEVVPVEIALSPSSTLFRRGDGLRLDIQGRWFSFPNPLLGQFPGAYEKSRGGTCILHLGDRIRARLTVPVIPPRAAAPAGDQAPRVPRMPRPG